MKATLSTWYRGAFVDHEAEREPLVLFVELELPADLGVEVAERAVVGGELVDVGVDLFAIDVAFEDVRNRRLGIDLGLEPAGADELVADEFDLPDLLGEAFVDHEHDAVVGRFVAFQDADLNVVEAVAVIQIDQPAAGFLNRVRIDRAADFEIGFLGELLGPQAVVAEVFDVADDRPLDDFENHNSAARRLLVRGLHIDEPAAAGQLANVALHERRVERPTDARLELIENLRRRNGAVADDADVGHGFIRCRERRTGRITVVLFLAEHRFGQRRHSAGRAYLARATTRAGSRSWQRALPGQSKCEG